MSPADELYELLTQAAQEIEQAIIEMEAERQLAEQRLAARLAKSHGLASLPCPLPCSTCRSKGRQ